MIVSEIVNTVNNDAQLDEAVAVVIAYSDPQILSTLTMSDIIQSTGLKSDVRTLHDETKKHVEKTLKGDASDQEIMLISQCRTLDILFNNMVSRAVGSKHVGQIVTYMEMAIKAQNSARKTISALHSIKNPQQNTFIGQQNLAFNQQVNNGELLDQKVNHEIELLTNEVKHASLDFRGTAEAIRDDQEMGALEAVNRRNVYRGQIN
jgi:hypothetical protein